MAEESERGIRPIWLIGGGAALVTIGLCALFSVLTAVGLIWFSSERSTNEEESTQAVIVNQTEGAATNVASVTTVPSPLPVLSTLPPQPTAIAFPTQPPSRPAPEQAVRSYYELVSQQRYDLTWSLLTDSFKQRFNCCAPSYNYSGYVQWWDSVNYVDFGDIRTVSQNGDRAVVYAELFWVMNTGVRSGMSSNPYIEVVYDTTMNAWRINDTRANP
jgi:hypothetical protein